ncbi:hypothetical protein PXK00_00695 [Phaeobacter sp. QD34_3]|uniref:hypothetical protein n=1 Tax=unclassified Phaeobacter TaxID=2621772 RepID=UPI00237FAF80|nr:MULTISPECIES: hypothetical protein [unclassified Phaeobacter]MDE4131611.1 hypothetical protein [Phaeobacter sp. QD34_3]MDE4135300.1 hypothetical protein [Phaeobacter sp. QD34_24]
MRAHSFEDRLDRIEWKPSAVPTREIVDSVLGAENRLRPRSVLSTLAGAILGILIGFGLLGMASQQSPWGPESGTPGLILGTLSLGGLVVSVGLALYAACRSQSHPRLMQFASMNLLMIVVLLLS